MARSEVEEEETWNLGRVYVYIQTFRQAFSAERLLHTRFQRVAEVTDFVMT